jgi:hypothetical protein
MKKSRRESDQRYINKKENFIKAKLQSIYRPSKCKPALHWKHSRYVRKGWKPELTLAELYAELILHVQLMKDKFPNSDGYLCRYCEQQLTFKRIGDRTKVLTNFSIDRFDTNITYQKGNIVFCCAECNSKKGNSQIWMWKKLLEIAKAMASNIDTPTKFDATIKKEKT